MTTPSHQAELLPCPNPWCDAAERDGDFSPDVVRGLFDTIFVACTSCGMKGPVRATRAEAIAFWNTRPASHEAELVEALELAIPRGVCLTNRNWPDSTVVPLDTTMGDLRKIAAILAKAKAGVS